ncbi:hypothetical protein Lfu02_07770 [Longispora fulva]|nr:hypothetical protein Lfu02_07770 [Longispora fulva]
MIPRFDTHHMRRFLLAVSTVFGLAVLIPAGVLAAASVGFGARHWSGAVLSGFSWPGGGAGGLTGSCSGDLGPVAALDAAHHDELAGFTCDGDVVVVFAASDAGEKLVRDGLRGYPHAWRVKRVAHSDAALRGQQDRIFDAVTVVRVMPPRVVEVSVDTGTGNCVRLDAVRLDHDLFARLGAFGDYACVVYVPGAPAAHLDDRDGSASERWGAGGLGGVVGTYLVLLTGFPWHIGAWLVSAVAVWVYPAVRRRSRRTD